MIVPVIFAFLKNQVSYVAQIFPVYDFKALWIKFGNMYIDLFRFPLFECFKLSHDPLVLSPYLRDFNLFIRITLSSRLDYDISEVFIGVDSPTNLP